MYRLLLETPIVKRTFLDVIGSMVVVLPLLLLVSFLNCFITVLAFAPVVVVNSAKDVPKFF